MKKKVGYEYKFVAIHSPPVLSILKKIVALWLLLVVTHRFCLWPGSARPGPIGPRVHLLLILTSPSRVPACPSPSSSNNEFTRLGKSRVSCLRLSRKFVNFGFFFLVQTTFTKVHPFFFLFTGKILERVKKKKSCCAATNKRKAMFKQKIAFLHFDLSHLSFAFPQGFWTSSSGQVMLQ